MVTHTIRVVPHITSTSPSWSAPATICSHTASTAPAASTASVSRTWPTAAPVVSTRGMASGAAPHSAQTASLQPLPSNNGYAVLAVELSITASPANAWLATAVAGQYPCASGASRAVQRRNSTASPERNVVSAPVATDPGRRHTAGPASAAAPCVVHGGQRRHHRCDRHRRGVVPARVRPAPSTGPPPGLVGVVLEPIRGGHQEPVRDSRPGHHLTVLVGGDGLDCGRADIDADCDGLLLTRASPYASMTIS